MTPPQQASPTNPPDQPAAKSVWVTLWSVGQFLAALGITIAFLAYLLVTPIDPASTQPPLRSEPPPEVVTIAGPSLIRVEPGSPFDQKVTVVKPRTATISDPIMIVTGRVVASLRPGEDGGEEFWQFDSPDTLEDFTEWERARADIVFNETQLEQIKLLAEAQLNAQREVVERLEKLVAAGTDSVRDLTAERASLLQIEISGRQDVYEAETALRMAKRDKMAQERKLYQDGLSPSLLDTITPDVDIVMADVPEGRIDQVRIGQSCRAKFFGLPKENFPGNVKSIAPSLATERRTLRILFTIDDPDDKLRPGMFAEIGLGTDERDALLVPADAILHIARSDYVLVDAGDNSWRVTEVLVGEPHYDDVEILSGLHPDDTIVGRGAILFKPLVVSSLRVRGAEQ